METTPAVNEEVLAKTVQRCRERNILLPTFAQLRDPTLIPQGVVDELRSVGLWDLNSRNLFRITWKNEPVARGGGFGEVNALEIPSAITGIKSKIFILLGKFFPTGAHKVGACFGPLVDRLTRGAYDPDKHKALWPSTGNYCRGGAFNSCLMGCKPIAVLPAGMSKERFEWLKSLGAEIHATPGCESNVKEVFDKTKELARTRPDEVVVLNQFEDFSNPLFHYSVTGPAMEEVFHKRTPAGSRLSGIFLTQGSAGTLAAGEYLKEHYPAVKVGAGEAMQCPTLFENGFGAHRIEGIGDKHVPWIHNLRNTDVVAALDDEQCMSIIRLFNTPAGHACLLSHGVSQEVIDKLALLGISGVANMLGCIKMAKLFEFNEHDVLFTVATDSMEMYQSRLQELEAEHGPYTPAQAEIDYQMYLVHINTEYTKECTHADRRRMHNLKYFTWIEQQGKTLEELNAQWYQDDYWTQRWHRAEEYDTRIRAFNARTGLDAHYPAPAKKQ